MVGLVIGVWGGPLVEGFIAFLWRGILGRRGFEIGLARRRFVHWVLGVGLPYDVLVEDEKRGGGKGCQFVYK